MLHLHKLKWKLNADQTACFMKIMPAKSRNDSENDFSYNFDKVFVDVGICVKVQKIHLKASHLPCYLYIMLCIVHIHFSWMPVTLAWKQGVIFLLGNEYNGSHLKHYQVCTHENLKKHFFFFFFQLRKDDTTPKLLFSSLGQGKYVKWWPTFGTISAEQPHTYCLCRKRNLYTT